MGKKLNIDFFLPFASKATSSMKLERRKKCKQEIMLEKVEDIDKEHNLKCLHLKI